jgi:hypothetical protein
MLNSRHGNKTHEIRDKPFYCLGLFQRDNPLASTRILVESALNNKRAFFFSSFSYHIKQDYSIFRLRFFCIKKAINISVGYGFGDYMATHDLYRDSYIDAEIRGSQKIIFASKNANLYLILLFRELIRQQLQRPLLVSLSLVGI